MLTVYTLEQSEQWDAAVRSFRSYDVYWLSGYVKAFQLHGDGEPLLFFYEDAQIRGINAVMKRDIALDPHFAGKLEPGTFFDLSTPYGYGGWILEGEGSEELFSAYQRWCVKNRIVCEFVRFHPMLDNAAAVGDAYTVIPLGKTVAMDLRSPEVIWANIISKNRNMIRKAQKNGIRIYNGRYPQIFETFRGIYESTMDKDNATAYYYFSREFYDSICQDLAANAQVFYAVLEGKVIAASIMLSANGWMNYHLSGSLREYAHLAPSNLLLYEAALWGSANGCRWLHMGGGVGSREDSLFKFKRSFYRQEELPQFSIGKKILDQNAYDELVAMRGGCEGISFFPRYRG